MKFLFLNCQAFSTAKYHLEELVEKYEIDVLCLNETWQPANATLRFKTWTSFLKPRGTDNHGGVGIFVNDNCGSFVAEQCHIFDRPDLEVVALKLRTNGNMTVFLVVAYIPPRQYDKLELLKQAIQDSKIDNVILMGDFNGKSPEWFNNRTDENGRIVENILTDCNMVTHNDGQATRQNSNSIIDLIITDAGLSTYVKSCDTLSHENVRSDHIAIISDIAIDNVKQQNASRTFRPLKC